MLKYILLFTMTVLFFTSSFANELPKHDQFQIIAGFKVNDIEDLDDKLKGLELQFGKNYGISESISAQIAIDLSYSRVKYNYYFGGVKVADSTLSEYTYGLLHTLYYNGLTSNSQIKPFFDVGIGMAHDKEEVNTISGYSDEDTNKRMYFKYGIGLQLLTLKGLGAQFRFGQQRNNDYYSNVGSIGFVYSI